MNTSIPLIDVATWRDGSEDQRRALAAEVDGHLSRLGFLVVINHGIPAEIIDGCRREAYRFFHQEPQHKAPLAVAETYRGWVGAGLESNAATYGVETPPDLKETYTFGPVDVPDPTLIDRAPRWFAANRWPDEQAAFRAAAEAWWREARSLADTLQELFAVALDLPEPYFVERSDATTASVSINWYWNRSRAAEPEPGQFRVGPHTDFGTLTILDRQPGLGGLQVKHADGTWTDAPDIPGSLIVNTGDMLRRWTNDRWCSNEHRVQPPPASAPTEELLSLIFFHEPNFDTMIEPLPTCVSDHDPARYPAVAAGDYLAAKLDALSVS